jgi:inward rectifier potassium channel
MSDETPARERAPTPSWRLINRDGTFNVARAGVSPIRFNDLYHSLLSTRRAWFLLFVVASYLFVNVAFAAGYFACGPGALEGAAASDPLGRFAEAFFFSVQTFSTIGYGRITPQGLAANLLVTAEALTGLLWLALSTGLLFARFARPTARVVFSDRAIIGMHDGVRSLIFRMANARRNQIVEAQVSVVVVRNETTAEGEAYRNFHQLKLERDHSSLFMLSWTVIHEIDEASPLFGATPASLVAEEAEIMVTLSGIDDTFSQIVHSRATYAPEDIRWGGRFADILSRRDGLVAMDLTRIHDVEEG